MSTETGVLAHLITQLMLLPGIGQKTAQRLAFAMLKMTSEETQGIAQAIINMKEKLSFCQRCNNMAEGEICHICYDPKRERDKVLVVEEPSSLYAIERTGGYRGLYHVLWGALSPLDGITPSDIKVHNLLTHLQRGEVKEVIIATDPNMEGEATAIYLTRLIKPLGIRVSRIAYGIPVGVDLEFADEVTLRKSLEGRREL